MVGVLLVLRQVEVDPPDEVPDGVPGLEVRLDAALVAAAVVICGLYYGREILIPLAIAFLITFALNPPVTWLVRRGLLPQAGSAATWGCGYAAPTSRMWLI
jgi:hypothetical protein